jgi:hypothetical protein
MSIVQFSEAKKKLICLVRLMDTSKLSLRNRIANSYLLGKLLDTLHFGETKK